ncbi:Os07g0682100 [Oryza sativa Japonica Group]|uniref:Os07g0682100 protein n=1 Tax=Oryza sativa subsp. japonica TaxID=39947 RepID=Q0D3K1_ORYSJ|nr:Os07g0682100 [Oryza sativa Japonica Group]|eukprot:NP_001060658.1 Os07g0682100 [Oryza sativa Japonica Group]
MRSPPGTPRTRTCPPERAGNPCTLCTTTAQGSTSPASAPPPATRRRGRCRTHRSTRGLRMATSAPERRPMAGAGGGGGQGRTLATPPPGLRTAATAGGRRRRPSGWGRCTATGSRCRTCW